MLYQKIPNVYNRTVEKPCKIIEGDFKTKYFEALQNCEWIFTEKVDGTNIRIMWDGYDISFGGRKIKSNIPKPLQEYLESKFMTPEMEELFEQTFGIKEVTLFGEGFGGKIQKQSHTYGDKERFILFDIGYNGSFYQRDAVEGIGKALGIDVVPVLFEGTLKEAVEHIKIRQNQNSVVRHMLGLEGDAKIEGYVGTTKCPLYDHEGKRITTKIKVRDFDDVWKEE